MIKFEIHAYDNVQGTPFGYMEAHETLEKALKRIEELKDVKIYKELNYTYRIYEAISN
jgi:hypothetical protein